MAKSGPILPFNAHFLRRNKGKQLPHHLVFIDVETEDRIDDQGVNTPILKLGWACYVRVEGKGRFVPPRWLFFRKAEEFWDWYESLLISKKEYYLIAHNVGFDFRILRGFTTMKERGWALKSYYAKHKVVILKWKRGKVTTVVMDNCNIFSMSLSELGVALGHPKAEVDFKRCSLGELSAYCKRDVEVMVEAWRIWLRFLVEKDMGNFRVTLASQALSAYRHRFMEYPVIIHEDIEAIKMERLSYHGARVECLRIGEYQGGPFYHLDINSAYPYIMAEKQLPCELVKIIERGSLRKLKYRLGYRNAIAEVLVETDEPVFPVLKEHELIYPVGRFWTVLSTPELKYALERGWIKEVRKIYLYRRKPIFRKFATEMWDARQSYKGEGNLPFSFCCKIMANALYGKFAQRGIRERRIGSCDPSLVQVSQAVNAFTKEQHRYLWIGGSIIEQKQGEKARNAFIAIASHITAYVRMYLWGLIKQAGRENVYYCDTDCVVVNQQGYENLKGLIAPGVLGGLKVEAESTYLAFYSKKHYDIGQVHKAKGIRDNAQKIGEKTYLQDQFLGLAGMIQRGVADLLTIRPVVKHLRDEVKTGVVGRDGWVSPFRIENLTPLTERSDYEWQYLKVQEGSRPSKRKGVESPPMDIALEEKIVGKQAWLDVLKESRVIPVNYMLSRWNYTKGQPKRCRDMFGHLVQPEYSKMDSEATELGFDSYDGLVYAMAEQAESDRRKRALREEIRSLRAERRGKLSGLYQRPA